MKNLLKSLVGTGLSYFGYKVVRQRFASRCPGYDRLDKLPTIRAVIDVGVGDQGSPFLYERYPTAFFLSIDPLDEAAAAVAKHNPGSRNVFVQTALGPSPGITTMKVSTKASRSSMLERVRNDRYSEPKESRSITISTLDHVLGEVQAANGPLQGPILLKIDTEGYEFECLKGGTEALSHIDYVILELPLTENYEGLYRFSEVIAFLSERGFEVFQILKAGHNNTDLLFTKTDDPLRRYWSYGI